MFGFPNKVKYQFNGIENNGYLLIPTSVTKQTLFSVNCPVSSYLNYLSRKLCYSVIFQMRKEVRHTKCILLVTNFSSKLFTVSLKIDLWLPGLLFDFLFTFLYANTLICFTDISTIPLRICQCF